MCGWLPGNGAALSAVVGVGFYHVFKSQAPNEMDPALVEKVEGAPSSIVRQRECVFQSGTDGASGGVKCGPVTDGNGEVVQTDTPGSG